jgi:L-2,4-diaminobutyrate transaminase
VDRLGLVANAGEVGAYLKASLTDAVGAHPNVGDIRGEGLLIAVDFVADRDGRRFFDPTEKVGPRVAAALLAEGVIARAMPEGDIIGFAPPLCLTRDEADITADALKKAVSKAL